MYMVVHTIKHPLTTARQYETFEDNYQLCDTMAEAQEIAQRLITTRPNGLYSYAICEVLESSEPHWVEKKENWGSDV